MNIVNVINQNQILNIFFVYKQERDRIKCVTTKESKKKKFQR